MASPVSVTPLDQDLWASDRPYMEMTARNSPLFPALNFNITGLNKDQYYKIVLTIERIDPTRYTFDSKSEQWIESKMRYAKDGYESKKIEHPHNILSGDFWMATPLKFENIRLSWKEKHAHLENVFLTPTMYKYAPVITVINIDTEEQIRIVVDAAQFIPVTNYSHKAIGAWKAAHNKYATFKHGGRGKRIREDSEDEQQVKRRKPLGKVNQNNTTTPTTSNGSVNIPTTSNTCPMTAAPSGIVNSPSTSGSNSPSPILLTPSPTQQFNGSPTQLDATPNPWDFAWNYQYPMADYDHFTQFQYPNVPFYNPYHSLDSSLNTTHSSNQSANSFFHHTNSENIPPYFPPF